MSFDNTSNPEYSEYIAKSRYARFRDDLGRRETWEETVDRVVDYWVSRIQADEKISPEDKKILLEALG